MGEKVGVIVGPSEVFPVDGIQSIVCPNCHEITPTGYSLQQHNFVAEHNTDLPVVCNNCQTTLFVQKRLTQ